MGSIVQVMSVGIAAFFFFGFWVMAEGTIKKLTDKGFGFIDTGGNKDLFFHSSNVECEGGYDSLHEGQKVSFTEGEGPKGPRAEHVQPV